jgi:hypothetical protein
MNNKQKNWTLFFGILTASVIVLSQLFWFQAATLTKKVVQTEQKSDAAKEATEEAQISLPSSSSLPSTNTVVVEHDFTFIHEILFEKETSPEVSKSVLQTAGKFFQTLFRVIISPNAP